MIVVKCRNCGQVLYVGKQLIETSEVVKLFGLRCPRCLAKLSLKPVKVEAVKRSGGR